MLFSSVLFHCPALEGVVLAGEARKHVRSRILCVFFRGGSEGAAIVQVALRVAQQGNLLEGAPCRLALKLVRPCQVDEWFCSRPRHAPNVSSAQERKCFKLHSFSQVFSAIFGEEPHV